MTTCNANTHTHTYMPLVAACTHEAGPLATPLTSAAAPCLSSLTRILTHGLGGGGAQRPEFKALDTAGGHGFFSWESYYWKALSER